MESKFSHFMIVRQEHLNQYGNLFGGRVLSVIDELAFVACAQTFPGKNFVTRAIQRAEFAAPARLGDVLEFTFHVERVGTTSVTVRVQMAVHSKIAGAHGRAPATETVLRSFDGAVVMVCVDDHGHAVPVKTA